ncbi:MAG: hypothetical protein OEO23_09840 [Gemmatimonadota bacterium]|nr:hypothetical protein [Gemmatimonadota bacterium]
MSSEIQNDETGMGRAYREEVGLPPTPVDEMWREIEGHLPGGGRDAGAKVVPLRRPVPWQRALAWPLAAGLILATGVALGRASIESGGGPDGVATDPPVVAAASAAGSDAQAGNREAYQALTRKRVAGMEPLLTMLTADAQQGRFDPEMAAWAQRQLTRTRLALDRPGAEDPAIRGLLEDLELIFVQVTSLQGLPPERAGQEMGLIAAALEEGGLLARVRAVEAAGP